MQYVRDAGPDNGLTDSRPLRVKLGLARYKSSSHIHSLAGEQPRVETGGCILCRVDSDVGGRSPARYKCHIRRS